MNFFKKNWAILVYLLVTIVLFNDFLFSNKILFGSDTLASGVFFRKLYADFVRSWHEMPLWNRFISGGLPFVDAMHGDTFYPTSILKFFMPLHRALGYKLVIHFFLAGSFMYYFLKSYKLNQLSSFLGGLFYMLSPMIVTLVYPGHDAKIYVAALLPLAFLFLRKMLMEANFRNYIYFGATVGFMILSSHIQTTYFSLWIIFFYLIFALVKHFIIHKDKKYLLRKFSFFWFAILFGLLIGAVQLVPPYIYSKQFSIRGTEAKKSFEHAISWGLHPEEAMNLFNPEFSGSNRSSHITTRAEYEKEDPVAISSYWGRNPFKLNNEYAGYIALLCFLLGFIYIRDKELRKEHYFYFGILIFALLYSLVDHTPFFYLAYKLIPGVNLFRGQSMIMFVFSFALATGSAFLFSSLAEADSKTHQKALIMLGSVTLINLFGAFATASFVDIFRSIFNSTKAPQEAYLAFIKQGFIVNLVLTIILAGIILNYEKIKQKNIILIASMLTLLIFLDTYRVNKDYLKTNEIDKLGVKFQEDAIIKEIKTQYQEEGVFRVLDFNMYGNNVLPIHGIETVRGFHDNELKWYRKYRGVNAAGVNTDQNLLKGLEKGNENNLLNIAGAKYLLFKGRDGNPQIMVNDKFMPRAYLVSDYEKITDSDKIVPRMLESNFDYQNKIILEEDPKGNFNLNKNLKSDDLGTVKLYKYEGNELKIEASLKEDALLFMSDAFFPYWRVFDQNNKEHEIYKADLTFRAIPLQKGDYQLRFKFDSLPYDISKYLTILGLLALLITVSLGFRKKREASL